jgi:glycosyltransferase involved in cell wall biosynthesis
VDDASTDGSAAQAETVPCRLVRLPANRGVGPARNRGAAQVSGDVILFTDGDVRVRPDVVARAVDILQRDPDLAALIGTYADECGAPGFLSDYRNLLHHYTHRCSQGETFLLFCACCFIRRDVFEAAGGFDETRFGRILEDVDLGQRLVAAGHRIRLDASLQVVHYKHYTWRSLVRADLFGRAVPWTRLILHRRGTHFGLATGRRDAAALGATGLAGVLLLAALVTQGPWLSWAAVAAAGLFTALNADRLWFFARRRGIWFAAGSWGMLVLHYVIGGIGLMIGTLQHLRERRERPS